MKPLKIKTKQEMDSKIETIKEVAIEFGTEVSNDLLNLKKVAEILNAEFNSENLINTLKEFDNHESINIEMIKNVSFIDGINFVREKSNPQLEDILAELLSSAIKMKTLNDSMESITKKLELIDKKDEKFLVDLIKYKLDAMSLKIKSTKIKSYVDGLNWTMGIETDEISKILKQD
jgi:predicted RNA binding protein with dsRBD fold (UPF0201 family)